MQNAVTEHVERLERDVWQALVEGDADADHRLLSDDFLGVYPTGFADRADHVGQLDAGPTMSEFALDQQRFVVLTDALVLFSYRARYRKVDAHQGSEHELMYITSLWCRRDGDWTNVFSQDTPAAPST